MKKQSEISGQNSHSQGHLNLMMLKKLSKDILPFMNRKLNCLHGVYEIISKGAFDNTINNDIRALWNHNTQYVLGRSKNGSLKLQADEKGLFGTIKLPNTQYANDLY